MTLWMRQIESVVGGGGTHLLLALVIHPLTTHYEAPSPLLIEAPPLCGLSFRLFHTWYIYTKK